jgi:AraC-like DNA-binding protein
VRASRGPAERVTAWSPGIPGIAEVLHARFVEHAYPVHTHDTWTLLIVDEGAIRYDLDRSSHGTLQPTVTLLPPHVPHDGRAATPAGFRKRVLYLDESVLDPSRIGAAVDRPGLVDARLRRRIVQLHQALRPGDELEAESRLALIRDRLTQHLTPGTATTVQSGSNQLAHQLRDLLAARTAIGVDLREAAALLHTHPTHLIRSFTTTFGIAPHAYLTGRRIDLARRLLLAGRRPAEVATAAGFYDQPHLTRQFRRYLGVTPAAYARADRLPGSSPGPASRSASGPASGSPDKLRGRTGRGSGILG